MLRESENKADMSFDVHLTYEGKDLLGRKGESFLKKCFLSRTRSNWSRIVAKRLEYLTFLESLNYD